MFAERMSDFMKAFFVLATLFFAFTVCGEGAPCDAACDEKTDADTHSALFLPDIDELESCMKESGKYEDAGKNKVFFNFSNVIPPLRGGETANKTFIIQPDTWGMFFFGGRSCYVSSRERVIYCVR